MEESPDHEPTLIEWGMGVHLNHPITAQRRTRNSRLARWELWMPHLSVPRRDGEGAYKQDGEPPRSLRLGPGSGVRRTATPPENIANAGVCQIRVHGTTKVD
jgi:hypothetical protein